MESIRKIIREIFEEEFNKDKRYVAELDMYIYAPNDQEAMFKAKEIADIINSKYDNQAKITKIGGQEFGTNDFNNIELDEVKENTDSVSARQLSYNIKNGLPNNWKGTVSDYYNNQY